MEYKKRVSDEQKIVITSDGRTVTAKKYDGKKVVYTATAKCSPDDTYDFDVGAKLAVERLFESKPTSEFEVWGTARVKKKSGRIDHIFEIGDVVMVMPSMFGLGRVAATSRAVHCAGPDGTLQYVPAEDLEKIEF